LRSWINATGRVVFLIAIPWSIDGDGRIYLM